MTNFNNDDWLERVGKAKNGKELGDLIMELPLPPNSLMNADAHEFSTMAQPLTSKPSTSTTQGCGITAG